MEGQDLGLPGPHGASQTRQLEELHAIAPTVEAVQRSAGSGQVRGGVNGTQQLLALPGAASSRTAVAIRWVRLALERLTRRWPG